MKLREVERGLACVPSYYSPLYVVEWGLPNIIGVCTKQKRNLPKAHILPFAGIDQAKGKVDPGSEYTVG